MKPIKLLNSFYILICVFLSLLIVQSCKKDTLTSFPTNQIGNQLIKKEVILKWINDHPLAQTLALDWSRATQGTIDGINVVRVPALKKFTISTPSKELGSIFSSIRPVQNGGAVRKIAGNGSGPGNLASADNQSPEVYFTHITIELMHDY